MIIIIIILTLFVFPCISYAQNFTPYSKNPVIVKSLENVYISQPFISKKGSQFTAWFSDEEGVRPHISTMKSSNGVDWYNKKSVQLSNTYVVGDPFMFENNNKYELYFSSPRPSTYSIWRSLSDDGVTFVQGSEKEILKPEQSWERKGVSCPTLIKDDFSTQYMFYAGSGTYEWALGLATSTDGITWNKCGNNPIVTDGAGPQIVKYNSLYYLFYHAAAGLQVQQTDLLNGCNTVWTNKHTIPVSFMDPAPLVVGNDLWLYGGTRQGVVLAATAPIITPSYPIVIIPGMFASWNSQALLHNVPVSYDTWKLNPNISEYDALIKTLQNNGKILNTDFYIFPYDWRSPIEESSYYLDTFLIDTIWKKNAYVPVQLVGHSLGGVIARIYADENKSKPIKQVVIASSPHLGSVQAYKPLAAGEVDRENSLMWMATKLALLLFKSELQSDKDTASEKLPVLFDLLPAFPFLKDADGSPVESSLVNSLIVRYPISYSPLQLYLGGSGRQTTAGYTVGPRTLTDVLFDIYSDGHPLTSWTEAGDGSILDKSMNNQITPAPTENHGEIIYSKQSIKTILSHLNISVEDSSIPVGKGTSIYPAILSFIQSPATMQIIHTGTTTYENDGMIHIQNAEKGEYILRITGIEEGEYTASVWLIGESNDKWIQFKKQTTNGKVDDYIISFDETTGGLVSEYLSPTPTTTPLLTIISSPTATPIATQSSSALSQSTSSKDNTSTLSNSQNLNTNTNVYGKNVNADLNYYSKKVPQQMRSTITPISPSITGKINVPQVLGVSKKNRINYQFPFAEIFFIQQTLWGICAALIILFNKIKKHLKTLKESIE